MFNRSRYKHRGLLYSLIKDNKYSQRGQFVDERGYVRYSDTNKLVHRHVAEKYIAGRKLLPGEDVHHKNRNKLDNGIENLEVKNHDDHMLHHALHGEHTVSYIFNRFLSGKKDIEIVKQDSKDMFLRLKVIQISKGEAKVMRKKIVILGIVVILVAVGLSGCNQITDSRIEIKLINDYDEEIHVTLRVSGAAIDEELLILSNINKTDDVYIATGGEKSVYFDNLILDFEDQSSVSTLWSLEVNSNLGHSGLYTLQEAENATSPSILQHGVTLTFHQDGTITQEG